MSRNKIISEEIKYIVSVVRALVTSCQQPCFLQTVLRDYKDIEGQPMPFMRLGHQSARELLDSTNEFNFSQYNGDVTISAKFNQKTAHIASMVQQQKRAKKRPQRIKRLITKGNNSFQPVKNTLRQQNFYPAQKPKYQLRQSASGSSVQFRTSNSNNPPIQPQRQYNMYPQQDQENRPSQCGQNSAIQKHAKENQSREQQHKVLKQSEPKLRMSNSEPHISQQRLGNAQPLQQVVQNQTNQPTKPALVGINAQPVVPYQVDLRHILNKKKEQKKENNNKLHLLAEPKVKEITNPNAIQNRLKVTFLSNDFKLAEDPVNLRPTIAIVSTPKEKHNHDAVESIVASSPILQEKCEACDRLSSYCLDNNLSQPKYSIGIDKSTKRYRCLVKVDNFRYSTYPQDFDSPILAKKTCANTALMYLKTQAARNILPEYSDTTDHLLKQIYNELVKHPHGMFAKKIPDWFTSRFEQTLPDNWLTLIKSSKRFLIETPIPNTIIVFANSVANENIVLPWHNPMWELFITHCVSTTEVWARLFGDDYSECFEKLIIGIEKSMKINKQISTIISCQQIYLVCICDCWHRVLVEEIDIERQTVLCFFIDFGDKEWFPKSELYLCPPEFLELPAQAIRFTLYGLESFDSNPRANQLLDAKLSNLSVVAELVTTKQQYEIDEINGNGKISVLIYDTSTEDDILLNDVLIMHICEIIDLPEIKRVGITNIIVTHISDEGDLHFQVASNELKFLQNVIQLLGSVDDLKEHRAVFDDLKVPQIFLVRDNCDKGEEPNWQRGVVIDKQVYQYDREVNMLFIDRGYCQRVPISNIFRLERINTALNIYPAQAIQARLHNIPTPTKNTIQRLRTLLPVDSEALIKLASFGPLPTVTVYKRLSAADVLSNINDAIRIEHELECCDDFTNTNTPREGVIIDKLVDLNISEKA